MIRKSLKSAKWIKTICLVAALCYTSLIFSQKIDLNYGINGIYHKLYDMMGIQQNITMKFAVAKHFHIIGSVILGTASGKDISELASVPYSTLSKDEAGLIKFKKLPSGLRIDQGYNFGIGYNTNSNKYYFNVDLMMQKSTSHMTIKFEPYTTYLKNGQSLIEIFNFPEVKHNVSDYKAILSFGISKKIREKYFIGVQGLFQQSLFGLKYDLGGGLVVGVKL